MRFRNAPNKVLSVPEKRSEQVMRINKVLSFGKNTRPKELLSYLEVRMFICGSCNSVSY